MPHLRFYAACLASYNHGVSHGAWINASDDVDDMQDDIAAMLRASPYPNVKVKHPDTDELVPSAEEWAVHDYDGVFPAGMGEYPGLAAIAAWYGVMKAGEERGLPARVVLGVVDNFGEPSSGEFPQSLDHIREHYVGTFTDLGTFAAHLHEETGEKIPKSLVQYINWDAMGRDMELNSAIFSIDDGPNVHVFWNR